MGHHLTFVCRHLSSAMARLINDTADIVSVDKTLGLSAQGAVARTFRNVESVSSHLKSSTLENNLKNQCGQNLTPQFICDELAQQLQAAKMIPPFTAQQLLALMVLESAGKCRAGDGLGSLGLFQIHNSSTKIARCTEAEWSQVQAILNDNLDRLSGAPQCRENPLVSISEAVKIMKQKQESGPVHVFTQHTVLYLLVR